MICVCLTTPKQNGSVLLGWATMMRLHSLKMGNVALSSFPKNKATCCHIGSQTKVLQFSIMSLALYNRDTSQVPLATTCLTT